MRPGLDEFRGGGAREVAPGTEEWTRLDVQSTIHKNVFAHIAAWRRQHQGLPLFVWPLLASAVRACFHLQAAPLPDHHHMHVCTYWIEP